MNDDRLIPSNCWVEVEPGHRVWQGTGRAQLWPADITWLHDPPQFEIREVAPPIVERITDGTRTSCPDCPNHVIVHDLAFSGPDTTLPHICFFGGRYWHRAGTRALKVTE